MNSEEGKTISNRLRKNEFISEDLSIFLENEIIENLEKETVKNKNLFLNKVEDLSEKEIESIFLPFIPVARSLECP